MSTELETILDLASQAHPSPLIPDAPVVQLQGSKRSQWQLYWGRIAAGQKLGAGVLKIWVCLKMGRPYNGHLFEEDMMRNHQTWGAQFKDKAVYIGVVAQWKISKWDGQILKRPVLCTHCDFLQFLARLSQVWKTVVIDFRPTGQILPLKNIGPLVIKRSYGKSIIYTWTMFQFANCKK